MTADKRTAFTTLYTVLETVLRLLAPFIPFTAEEIYRALRAHADAERLGAPAGLSPWREASLHGRRARDGAWPRPRTWSGWAAACGRTPSLKTRQPLGRLLVHSDDDRAALLLADPSLVGYVAEELNVKRSPRWTIRGRWRSCRPRPTSAPSGPRFGKQSPRWPPAHRRP